MIGLMALGAGLTGSGIGWFILEAQYRLNGGGRRPVFRSRRSMRGVR